MYKNIDNAGRDAYKYIIKGETIKESNENLIDFFENVKITRYKEYLNIPGYFNIMKNIIKAFFKLFDISKYTILLDFDMGNQFYKVEFITEFDKYIDDNNIYVDVNYILRDLNYNYNVTYEEIYNLMFNLM